MKGFLRGFAIVTFWALTLPSLCFGADVQSAESPLLQSLPSAQALGTADLYASVQSSVVLIKTSSGLGAGFLVKNKRLVATAHHVVEEGGPITVISREGIEYQAEIFAWKAEDDLAILELERDFETAEPLALRVDNSLEVGTPVVMVGHPFGDYADSIDDLEGLLTWTITSGIVGGMSSRFIQTDAASSPGNSGGPILDMRGRVVGVVSARLDGAEGLTFSVPAVKVATLLNNPGIRPRPEPAPLSRFGIGISRYQTQSDLWMNGIYAAVDRTPQSFGARWGASIGYNRVDGPPEGSTLFQFSQELYWVQGEVGLRLLSPFGRGSLDPFVGLRGGWHEQTAQSIVATFADPECANSAKEECSLDVSIDESGTDSGFVPIGVVGAAWNGPLITFGVMALLGKEADMRLRLGGFFTVWF